MTDYERGLEKLGLWHRQYEYVENFVVAESSERPIDLRKDPAFAWRVYIAFIDAGWTISQDPQSNGYELEIYRLDDRALGVWHLAPADALYAAVEQLGKQQ